ncbi:MAG TPA: 1-deoxy-D-xylulose-5-phosphate reductoisomerase [Dehalococcoidia bacterium]|nr:1-deoxy-D-xylulose-5-phosphate reductoisomerase [Dehalococcoidia bacterium]
MGDSVTRVALLGSTGSIGTQALEVLRGLAPQYRVAGLAAGRNVALLARQIAESRPQLVSLEDARMMRSLPEGLPAFEPTTAIDMASHPDVDLVIVGTSGKAGLAPILAALRAGKDVALANKEALVMAGGIIMDEARRTGRTVRPIDSEHSAIWQCLWGEDPSALRRIILTASGGAFRDLPLEALERVSPEEALRHPTWNMGPKITVDSATLMNKGMEVIEAHWLFDVPLDRIDVILHRESIVHSMVEMHDGSVKAQLGWPDMRLPIRCALTYPARVGAEAQPALDLTTVRSLTFDQIDRRRFPCLDVAIEAGSRGGTYPAAMAAADEVAVELFLARRLGFMDIASVVEEAMLHHPAVSAPSLDDILEVDEWARDYVARQATAHA